MAKLDSVVQGELLPLIPHEIEGKVINQRATDGYVNATAMCNSAGKKIAHYLENKTTKEFLVELSSDVGIPISELIQIVKGGTPDILCARLKMKADLQPSDTWLYINLDNAIRHGNERGGNREMVKQSNPMGVGLYWPRMIMKEWME